MQKSPPPFCWATPEEKARSGRLRRISPHQLLMPLLSLLSLSSRTSSTVRPRNSLTQASDSTQTC